METITRYIYNGQTYHKTEIESVFAQQLDDDNDGIDIAWFQNISVSHWIKNTYPKDWEMAFDEWVDQCVDDGEMEVLEIPWKEHLAELYRGIEEAVQS